jgi:hypothetical protein
MKGLLIFLIVFVFYTGGYSQKPGSIDYQALIRNASGQLVISKTVRFRLSIVAGSPSGFVVYSETQSSVTNKDGLVSLKVGTGNNKNGSLSTIDWNDEKYFLKVESDPEGGNSYSEMSAVQLINVSSEVQKQSSKRTSEIVIEDEFLVTRKYVGDYLDYRHTGPSTSDGPNIIWIKTTLDKTFGKLSAYGKSCDFRKGDKLYLRRIFYSPGDVSGYWVYHIENDSSVYYRLSEFQYDKKVFVETLFSE